MGPPSYMRSVVDRNVVMRRMAVFSTEKCYIYVQSVQTAQRKTCEKRQQVGYIRGQDRCQWRNVGQMFSRNVGGLLTARLLSSPEGLCVASQLQEPSELSNKCRTRHEDFMSACIAEPLPYC